MDISRLPEEALLTVPAHYWPMTSHPVHQRHSIWLLHPFYVTPLVGFWVFGNAGQKVSYESWRWATLGLIFVLFSSQLPHRWLESSYWLITLELGCECVCVCVCVWYVFARAGLCLQSRLAQSGFEGDSSFLSIIFYWKFLLESLTFCLWE